MRILHICSYYPTSRIYRSLFERIDRQDVGQNVYVPLPRGGSCAADLELSNGAIEIEPVFNNYDRILYFPKVRKIIDAIERKDISGAGFDLCHAHSLFVNGYVARALKQKHGIEYIVTARSTDLRVFFRWAFHLRRIGLAILRDAARVVCVSPCSREELLEQYVSAGNRAEIASKTEVIPNGIDEFWLKSATSAEVRASVRSPLRLLYAGRMLARKNIGQIVRALKKLNDTERFATLDLVGNGPVLPGVRDMIRDDPAIQWHDWTNSRKRLMDMYRSADIFIMPSVRETFGLVYLEAMSLGLPIIYSANEGIDGFFEDGTVGYRVDPDDVDAIVRAVLRIMGDYRRLSDNAVRSVSRFGWHDVVRLYLDLYGSVVRRE